MTDAARLSEMLAAAARGRGVASLAVVPERGAQARAWWVPELDEEPAFLAYSITKTFTAALILSLCDAGRLALDDRLARWFPRVAHADRISLRALLDHTAGIRDYGGLRAYHDDVARSPSSPWPFERFAAETIDVGPWFEPGQGWAYSNPGYMLLRRIAEDAAGASYHDLVDERVARPLGLARTFVAGSIADLAALAPGTSRMLSPDGAPRDVRTHYHPGWVSHGVVASTASDIARFLDALFRGELLTRSSFAEMTRLADVPIEASADAARCGRPAYGLGLMVYPESRWGRVMGHNGGGPCYTASAFHAADVGRATVCAMAAIEDGFGAEDLVLDVLDVLAVDRSPASAARRTGDR